MVKKVIKKINKPKQKPKQKQKQKQQQRQNIVVNISNPKQQKEDKGYLPMMPSFNFPPPQTGLGDISQLLNFISSRDKTESKLGISIPEVKPTEYYRRDLNFPFESNVKENLLGDAINNKVNEESSFNQKNKKYIDESNFIPLEESMIDEKPIDKNIIINKKVEEASIKKTIKIKKVNEEQPEIIPKEEVVSTKRKYNKTAPNIEELRLKYYELTGQQISKKVKKNKLKEIIYRLENL